MTTRLNRALLAAERPILARHDLPMWGYSVLIALDSRPIRTQTALADAIHADKTRLIGVLDHLEQRGLIERISDPADRRARLLSITPTGQRLYRAVQRDIRRNEERLLGQLEPRDRNSFLVALGYLATLPADEIVGKAR
jgi:MarR family transcriptional regulator, organic hydroperoxide resistance regulator